MNTENSPSLSNTDYVLIKQLTERLGRTAILREKLIEKGDVVSTIAYPDHGWMKIQAFSGLFNPSSEDIATLRLQTSVFGNAPEKMDRSGESIPFSMKLKYMYYTNGLPNEMIMRPPEICGEYGWRMHGSIVNTDMLVYQRHLTVLYRSGLMSYLKSLRHLTILEIGGGYGAFAYYLKKIFPFSRYYLVDLPESLAFQVLYLGVAMKEYITTDSIYDRSSFSSLNPQGSTITFIPNFLVHDLEKRVQFDFVINTGSLGEMSDTQVRDYIELIHKCLKQNGVFYEENGAVISQAEKIVQKMFHGEGRRLRRNERVWFLSKNIGDIINGERRKIPQPLWHMIIETLITLKAFLRYIREKFFNYPL